MSNQVTRARHAAPRPPRTTRRFSRLIAAVLRPVTLTPAPLAEARVLDAVPSMELPEGFMAQRPVRMLAPGEGRVVANLSTPDAPTIVMDAVKDRPMAYDYDGDLHLHTADMGPALCGAEVPEIFRTTMHSFADCKKCIAIADQAKAEDERSQVMVRSQGSQFNGRLGHVVERDEEGGYEVEIPGVEHLLHFEASEVQFIAAVTS